MAFPVLRPSVTIFECFDGQGGQTPLLHPSNPVRVGGKGQAYAGGDAPPEALTAPLWNILLQAMGRAGKWCFY